MKKKKTIAKRERNRRRNRIRKNDRKVKEIRLTVSGYEQDQTERKRRIGRKKKRRIQREEEEKDRKTNKVGPGTVSGTPVRSPAPAYPAIQPARRTPSRKMTAIQRAMTVIVSAATDGQTARQTPPLPWELRRAPTFTVWLNFLLSIT